MCKSIFALFAVFLMTGCATSTLSSSDASKFANYEMPKFFQERFIEEEKTPIWDSIGSATDSMTKWQDGYRPKYEQATIDHNRAVAEFDKKTTGLMPDGKTIIYKSAYTVTNNAQLYRPSREANIYCKATGKRLKVISANTANFPSRFYSSPSQAFAEAMAKTYNGSVSTNLGGVTVTNDLNNYKTTLAQYDADLVNRQNAMYDRDGAIKGYQEAAEKKVFGVYECTGGDGSKKDWRVSILPFSFEPRDPKNQLIPHFLKILIVPEYM